jgi:Trk K+ transport system NAD-binding subunit/nucleotide-binding universal stress UspA family protein
MRAIVTGAGGVARELLRRLSEVWEAVVVDTSEERLAAAARVRPVATVLGDASSRLVLRRAGLNDADALIAATEDDDVNLEACRHAREAGLLRVVAVAAAPERLPEYQRLGVRAFSPASLTARQLELQLHHRRVTSTAFAQGRAEAIEFRIEDDSPVRGRALKELAARSWLIGAVLRQGQLVIPHGDTVLQAGDLVTVVGSARDFSSMVRTFTSGQPRFPLDFGKRVAVAATGEQLEAVFAESVVLARNSRATSLLVVHLDPTVPSAEADRLGAFLPRAEEMAQGVELHMRPVRRRPLAALTALPQQESVGVLVVPAPEGRRLKSRLSVRRLGRLVRSTGLPLLISRGQGHYRRILVPARDTPAARAALRAGVDLARASSAELVALAVADPDFIAGENAVEAGREALDWLQEEAAAQGVKVRRRICQGNPVKSFLAESAEVDLVVLGHAGTKKLFQVEMLRYLARSAEASVLIVPAQE